MKRLVALSGRWEGGAELLLGVSPLGAHLKPPWEQWGPRDGLTSALRAH